MPRACHPRQPGPPDAQRLRHIACVAVAIVPVEDAVAFAVALDLALCLVGSERPSSPPPSSRPQMRRAA